MSFQEKTSVSWFGRIGRSLVGLLIGIVLVIAMVVLLFWNEGRAVTTARSLAEGAGLVTSVAAETVDAAQEGNLVHVSGTVDTQSSLSDSRFGITEHGVRLVRRSEMYQWTETRKTETVTKLGGGEETVTTYTYDTGWSDRPHDSSRFREPDGRTNPPMEIQGQSFQVPEATLGAFSLSQRVLSLIGGARQVALSPDMTDTIQQAVGAGVRASVADGRIYLGAEPSRPSVGDYRISYELVPLGPISVIGRQAGNGFEPYQTRAGNQLLMVDSGTVSAQQMFDEAQASNTVLTWIVRAVGLVFMIVGFALFLSPLGVVGDVIPVIGSIIRMGTGLVAAIVGIMLGTVTIAIAWFYYRPLTALIILAIGFLVAYALTKFGNRKAAADATPPAQPA